MVPVKCHMTWKFNKFFLCHNSISLPSVFSGGCVTSQFMDSVKIEVKIKLQPMLDMSCNIAECCIKKQPKIILNILMHVLSAY